MEHIHILQLVKEGVGHMSGSMQRIDTEQQGKKVLIGSWKFFDVYKIDGDMITIFMVMSLVRAIALLTQLSFGQNPLMEAIE
jgi:hypothetical protein